MLHVQYKIILFTRTLNSQGLGKRLKFGGKTLLHNNLMKNQDSMTGHKSDLLKIKSFRGFS